MAFYERENDLINIIMQYDRVSVEELLKRQYTSKSTLRRDLKKLEEKGLIIRTHGGVMPVKKFADEQIPFFMRESEQNEEKERIAKQAVELIHDGDVIMLDATTSAYRLIKYFKDLKDIIVITSGAKASYLLGEMGIKNICTGGHMINKSFSYVGQEALDTISKYNADITFFSCRGLSEDGFLSDNSIEENEVRKMMMKHAKRKVFLCNSEKIGHSYLNNLCHVSETDTIISNEAVPPYITSLMKQPTLFRR